MPGLRSTAAAAAVVWQPAMACAVRPHCLVQAVRGRTMRVTAASHHWVAVTSRQARATISAAAKALQPAAPPPELHQMQLTHLSGGEGRTRQHLPTSAAAALKELQKDLAAAEAEVAALQSRLGAAATETSQVKQERVGLQMKLQQLRAAAENGVAQLRRAVAAAQADAGELSRALNATKSSEAAAKAALTAAKRETADARQQLAKQMQVAEAAAAAAASNERAAAAAGEGLLSQLTEAGKRAERLEAELQMEAALRQQAVAASTEAGEHDWDTAGFGLKARRVAGHIACRDARRRSIPAF